MRGRNSFNILLLLLSILLFFIGLPFKSINVLLLSISILVMHNLLYCYRDISNNILFFCFNITFSIFLIGRMIITSYFGYKKDLRGISGLNFTDPELIILTIIVLYTSLITIFIGYYSFKKLLVKFPKKYYRNTDLNTYLEISSLILFYLSIIFRLYVVVEMRQVTVNEGYFETFAVFKSQLPGILLTFSNMYDMFFFAFLATLPSKNKTLLPTFLFILEGAIAASSGRRSVLMLNILIVVIYYIIRNARKDLGEVWFGKKEKLISILSFPLLMTVMTIIGNMRVSSSNKIQESTGFFNGISEFIYSQGVSANLIGYTEMHKSQLPRKYYTLGPIFEFVTESIIKPFKGIPSFYGQTSERAMNGYLYSHTIPYFIDSRAYLMGFGWGSSLVAENYVDGGLIGVVLGGLLYGLIIILLNESLINGNFIIMTFSLSMSRIILFSPRGAYLSFLVSAFSPKKIIAVVLVYILGYILKESVSKYRRT